MRGKKIYKSVLTIAGSDSGGCAGIQADIKSISACGAFAASVITASTAQNTQGVMDIHLIPTDHIEKQLDAVLNDIKFNAIKIGMLNSSGIIELVKTKLIEYKIKNIVIDPVMIATSGHKLINDSSINSLKKFLPHAILITPNCFEAEILIGKKVNFENAPMIATELGHNFNTSVLLKGGHIDNKNSDITDFLFIREINKIYKVVNQKVVTNNTHGTGCSLSSSIAAFLSQGFDLKTSVINGCNYVNNAINNGKKMILGNGNGPINHFGLK